jgi:hypothetical protein
MKLLWSLLMDMWLYKQECDEYEEMMAQRPPERK